MKDQLWTQKHSEANLPLSQTMLGLWWLDSAKRSFLCVNSIYLVIVQVAFGDVSVIELVPSALQFRISLQKTDQCFGILIVIGRTATSDVRVVVASAGSSRVDDQPTQTEQRVQHSTTSLCASIDTLRVSALIVTADPILRCHRF